MGKPIGDGLNSNVDKYLEDIVDISGNINLEKMNDLKLAIQKGTFSKEDISYISKNMSQLGITKEYETIMKSMDFGTYLKNIVGDPPTDMINPHAHHILFKTGNGATQQALVEEGQAIMRKYGIDPVVGVENLVWAPNAVTGQHNVSALEKVVNALKEVDEASGDYDDIVEALEFLGLEASLRK